MSATPETRNSNADNRFVTSARQDIINLLAGRLAKAAVEKAQKPLEKIKEQLPQDSKEVRELPFYDAALQAIQYQRDNYLVGSGYARSQQQRRTNSISQPLALSDSLRHFSSLPYDSNALGSIQIAQLGSWFIPSPTVKDALLPIVLTLPSGSLRSPILNSTVNAIPLAQPLVDHAVKSSLMTFMSNSEWRQVIKLRTQGLISSNRGQNDSQGQFSSIDAEPK